MDRETERDGATWANNQLRAQTPPALSHLTDASQLLHNGATNTD